MPEARHLGCDVLQLEVEVRRRGGFGSERMKQLEGELSQYKRICRAYGRMKLNHRRRAKRRLPKRHRVPLYVPRLPDTV